MTHDTHPRDLMSIGELSRRTGVPVRTIRFYSDAGILPSRRTAGGHRVFEPGLVDRLLAIRRMRTLGLGLADIAEVVAGRTTIEDAVIAARADVRAQLDALSWRHASLLAIEQAASTERADRIALLAQVPDRAAARGAIIGFWRRLLAAMPAELFDDFAEMDVPRIPANPTPDQVVAFAELVRLVGTPELGQVLARQLWRTEADRIRDRRALLLGLADAYADVAPHVLTDIPPSPGPELDRFVAVHAEVRGRTDTAAFRRELAVEIPDSHPVTGRYWALTGEILGTTHTTGTAQRWLHTALRLSVAG
ncbi:MerR family transcriptional regulator [Nocardia cyriacigeorgica]|uniref:Mercuric resistance operon regulatory protein n=1 Tax=Nocardia cyriacigeorgica TaxID=135487 RepID=A0A4U8VZS9_9NOCA|nr:MerR family transcriptional regulator [Nocardia cyriacigeorgica]MBF6098517.1 MerR family transcriptional regulator [Nocardia cyriacigeorgica]MBF6160675.1 MerR family transcriptional regulator [Nocardia cyriacigeorgica]MBF6199558.1 MerR family transcriptional regulator [Nocardia cyriacigeorgica]MBF6320143.1 MerR family transcriptional regulator [Nocardia cyriacigeorgica]MBF6516998.1 MerR family transcriptional regulator [Nocardia cyriacigeorgica]